MHAPRLAYFQTHWLYRIAAAAAVLFVAQLWLAPMAAQTYPRARLDEVIPPGAKAGSTVEVTVQGGDLDDVKDLLFSDARIKVQYVAPPKAPIDPKTKKPKKGFKPGPPKYKVTVPADVPPGVYDIRAVGKWGISNPRAFAVGDLKEVAEKEANNDVTQMQKIDINTTVNAVISGNTDVDFFSFAAKKGQHVVVYCAASEIDSRLDPLVEFYWKKSADKSIQLGSNRRYNDRNAVVACEIPADGEFYVRVCQFAYTFGGSEAFYRLSVSTSPWIDAIYPPVVQAGKPANVAIYGKNLPGGAPDPSVKFGGQILEKSTVTVNPPMEPMNDRRVDFPGLLTPAFGTISGFGYHVKNAVGHSNPALITYSQEPVVMDNGKNNDPKAAQKLTLPTTVCGKIEFPRDRDWYTFTAKKGEVFTFEGISERLGTNTDVFIHVWRITETVDPKTKEKTENRSFALSIDSHSEIPDRIGRFSFYTSDPKGRYVIPADGEYRMMVSTRGSLNRTGPRTAYRVNIRKEEPDFTLIMVSNDTANIGGFLIHQGSCQEMSVIVLRRDGFDGEILLEATGLPTGVTCQPQVVGNKLKQGYLVLEAAANAPFSATAFSVKGTATIDGKKVVRPAQAGCLVWPAPNNVPAISRLSRSICLSVREKGPFSMSTNVKDIEVPVGGKGELKVTINRLDKTFTNQVQVVRLSSPALSNGAFSNFPNINVAKGKTEATIKYTLPTNTLPGTYNLVFQGKGKHTYYPDPKNKKQKRNTDVYEVAAPIKIVVYNKVAELKVANPNLKVQAGKNVDLVVNVQRLHNYKGEFNLQFKAAGGFGGISAANTKIAANANQAKITIKTAKNAKVGASPNFEVRATAKVGNVTFTHVTKFQLTITKAVASRAAEPSSIRTARLERD